MRRAWQTFRVQFTAALFWGCGWGIVCLTVATSAKGDVLYWAENTAGTGIIKQYDVATGLVSTLVTGTGSGVSGNHIDYPIALTVDRGGNVYVGNAYNGDIVKVTPQGVASDYFAVPDPTHYPHTYGLTFDPSGNLYVAMFASDLVAVLPAGSSTEAVFASGLDRPQGGASDPGGNIYVLTSETLAGANVQKITPAGAVATFATGVTGLCFDSAGNLFTGLGDGSVTRATPSGQMSILATGLTFPVPLGVDAAGNLYLLESNTVSAFDLITPSGDVSRLVSAPYAQGYAAASVGVPEPSSAASLVLTALLCLAARCRRRAAQPR